MRLELITPESEPSRRLRRWRLIQFPQLTMPLLAALTPPDVEIHHTDEIVEPVDLERPADLIAITCNTPAANHVYRLADAFRQRGRKVVLGGPHVTVLPEEAMAHADAVVIGEAESVWAGLIDDFRQGSMRRVYRGQPTDLRNLPHARRDLIEGRAYGRGVIIATRGCPNGCGYCSIANMYGRGQRRRPVEEVAREVAAIPGHAVIFWDDHLTADREYALKLFGAIAPYHKWWTTQTTLQAAFDPDLLAAAAASGCKALFIGLESISQESLNSQGKGFNQVARYEQAVANLHRHGIAIQAGTMFGLDGDDPGIFERTLKYYREIGLDSATV
ncbi:MAG: B12-binding domain-containing radical SAM protein, partial [Chloroflexota bacterium]